LGRDETPSGIWLAISRRLEREGDAGGTASHLIGPTSIGEGARAGGVKLGDGPRGGDGA
jgi:hypothetical protein